MYLVARFETDECIYVRQTAYIFEPAICNQLMSYFHLQDVTVLENWSF